MDTKKELFDTDISVLKRLSVSQIVLGIALLIVSASTTGIAVHILWQMPWGVPPLLFYAVSLELMICLVSLFIGFFGVYTVRKPVRVRRQFEILTFATFVNAVLILLALSMDAIAMLLELSMLDKIQAYSFSQINRSVPVFDIMVHLLLVGLLITTFQVANITRFNALVLGAEPATEVVRFRKEKNLVKEEAYAVAGPVEPLINV